MTDPDKLFPDHPALVASRSVGRSLYTGIVDVITRDELRQKWIMQGEPEPFKYEGGIDYERPEPPSGADGLVVVEFKQEKTNE
jgi:hypothetical protein